MLPSELKLTSLGHCYVHLPETFVSSTPTIKGGVIVSIRSLQTDNQICVMWNGQLTSGEHVQLDLTFAQANNFKDELVIISLVENLELAECTFCRVELVDSSDYNIISQHSEANLLDTCRLINPNLIVPIYISQYVKVLVKVLSFEPNQPFGLLTKWTQMNFEHNFEKLPDSELKKEGHEDSEHQITNHIPLISCALGIQYKPRFHLGSVLVYGERGSGKTHFIKKILSDYKKYHSELFNCKQLRGKRPENVKKIFSELLASAYEKQPSIIALDDVDSFLAIDSKHDEQEKGHDALYKKRLVDAFCHMLKQLERQVYDCNGLVVVIASCRSMESLDERISKPKGRRYFNEIIKVDSPNLQKRIEILKSIIDEQNVPTSMDDEQFTDIAQKCNSYMPSDLRKLVERALIGACSRTSLDFNSDPVAIQHSDFVSTIGDYTPMNLRSISLQPKTLRTFDSVGGMAKIKEILVKTVLLPIKYPKLYKKCPLKSQNSILLYGPPGCGKTLIAEALTNQEGINSICIRGPELLSKYIGASEAAVRDVFKRAQLARPCIIFFDEFESLVAKRGADSTGVTDRVVNQFLTLLDGVESLSRDVFILAATSRPDMIDPAMLRPGRLDRHIYCPLPGVEDRHQILSVLSKDMELDEQVRLDEWSERLDGFTGADIQALLCSAQLKALHKLIGPSTTSDEQQSEQVVKSDLEIRVSTEDLVEVYEEMRPNVSARFNNLINQYPSKIGQSRGVVAMRATLA